MIWVYDYLFVRLFQAKIDLQIEGLTLKCDVTYLCYSTDLFEPRQPGHLHIFYEL